MHCTTISSVCIMVLSLCLSAGCVRGGQRAGTTAQGPLQGEVRVAVLDVQDDDPYSRPTVPLDQMAERVVHTLLHSAGLPVEVECLGLTATARDHRSFHAEVRVSFPEGVEISERATAQRLLASLAPTNAAFTNAR